MVSAAGAVDHDEVVQLAEKAFSGLSSDPATATDLIKAVHECPLMFDPPKQLAHSAAKSCAPNLLYTLSVIPYARQQSHVHE